MPLVKITDGEVVLKEFVTRKLKKEINRVMDITMVVEEEDNEDKKEKTSKLQKQEISMTKFEEANDTAILGMIEKITLKGSVIENSQKFLDELRDSDYKKILESVQKVMGLES